MDFLSFEKHLRACWLSVILTDFPVIGENFVKGNCCSLKRQRQEQSGNILEQLLAVTGCVLLLALTGKASSGRMLGGFLQLSHAAVMLGSRDLESTCVPQFP